MMQWVRNVLGFMAAVVVMGLLVTAAFMLSRSTPDVHPAWFYGAAGILYSMIVLFWLNRRV